MLVAKTTSKHSEAITTGNCLADVMAGDVLATASGSHLSSVSGNHIRAEGFMCSSGALAAYTA